MRNKVEDYIQSEIKKYGTLCFPLIDSESSLDASLLLRRLKEWELLPF